LVGAAVDIIVPVAYAVSMSVLFVFGVHLFVLARAGRRLLPVGKHPRTFPAGPRPRVTVQVPLYNEALVAHRILEACAGLSWPHDRLQIQVLDDSTDETSGIVAGIVRDQVSRGVPMEHVRRSHRTGFKAGALAHGLERATGEFIAILDADFVPDADFLERLMPLFDADDIGLVQARWGHLNEHASVLTRVQAMGLDAHFLVEQRVRHETGCFINFNGTAGIWRRTAIDSAGGWQSDTLTEDLDLSYRAQLAGWRLLFDVHTMVPAELPVSMNAFRAQQHRWTKGGMQTALKMLGPLWRAPVSWVQRLEGTVHLTANMVFPFIVLAALTHGPVVWLEAVGRGPGPVYFGFMAVGVLGFVGFFLAHLVTQRAAHASWVRHVLWFPVFLTGSIGMCLNNGVAAWEIVRQRQTPFVRTPKFALGSGGGNAPGSTEPRHGAWWTTAYASVVLPRVLWVELAFGAWSAWWLVQLMAHREWVAVPFQFLFTAGFLFVALYNLTQARWNRS